MSIGRQVKIYTRCEEFRGIYYQLKLFCYDDDDCVDDDGGTCACNDDCSCECDLPIVGAMNVVVVR